MRDTSKLPKRMESLRIVPASRLFSIVKRPAKLMETLAEYIRINPPRVRRMSGPRLRAGAQEPVFPVNVLFRTTIALVPSTRRAAPSPTTLFANTVLRTLTIPWGLRTTPLLPTWLSTMVQPSKVSRESLSSRNSALSSASFPLMVVLTIRVWLTATPLISKPVWPSTTESKMDKRDAGET